MIFLGLILMSAVMYSQVTAITAESTTLSKKYTYYSFTVSAGDTCGTEQDTVYYEILSNKNTPLSVNAHVTGTRTGTTDYFGMTLEGKVWSSDSYTKIDSINTGLVAGSFEYEMHELSTSLVDSINQATINSGLSDNYYRYFRIMITNDGTCAAADLFTPSVVEIKLYER